MGTLTDRSLQHPVECGQADIAPRGKGGPAGKTIGGVSSLFLVWAGLVSVNMGYISPRLRSRLAELRLLADPLAIKCDR